MKYERRQRPRRVGIILSALMALILMVGPPEGMAQTTGGKTPVGTEKAHLKWEQKLGDGYGNAPTPPLVRGAYVYFYGNKYVCKVNKRTGKIVKKSKALDGTPYYSTIPLLAGGDHIYAFTSKGKVARLNADTLAIQGYSEAFAGQNITPLAYENGCVYGGTWSPSAKSGTYFCLDGTTLKTRWSFQDGENGGYYWAGAYVAGEICVFGSDSGNLYSVRNGTAVSRLTLSGSIRSSVRGDDRGNLYFTSSEGTLHKVHLGQDGTLKDLASASLGSPSVNTPIIAGNLLYVTCDKGLQIYDISGEGLKKLGAASSPSVIKGEILYSSATKCLYGGLYQKGTLYFFKLSADGRKVSTKGKLYVPKRSQYCVSPVTGDETGNLYYKNDSGYVFCLTAGIEPVKTKMKLTAKKGKKKATLRWKKVKGVSGYQMARAVKKSGKYKKVKTIKKQKTKKWTDRKLKSGKIYYYKIRSYRIVAGSKAKIYGPWSKAVKVKTR